ncbi:MAG: MucB/RseB C-terminal domain-containing protein, partial [Burkholderiales bacterium]
AAQRALGAGGRGFRAATGPRTAHSADAPDRQKTPVRAAGEPLLWCVMALANVAAFAADTPQTWLDRMTVALTTRNYEGVYSHWLSGRVETLRIVHRVVDGAVTERLESLDGSGRQFVRDGAELTCYLPDQRTVLVEKAPRSLMPASLPKFDSGMTQLYQLETLGTMRQMGRKAQVISVTPRDGFRYGYRLWIERATGMPLKTELLDTGGSVIEQVVFSSLSMRQHITDAEFKPQMVTTGFEWLRDDGAPAVTAEGTGAWANTPLPPGFHLMAQAAQRMPGIAEPVTHLVFSDGIATVSVFVQTETFRNSPSQVRAGVAQVGSSSAFTSVQSGHKFVALGEVPPATVRFIIEGLLHQSTGQPLGLQPPPTTAAKLDPAQGPTQAPR